MKLHPQYSFYNDRVEFWIAEDRGDKRAYGQPIVMEVKESGLPSEPAFALEMHEAQEFFEKLWAQGFRSKHDRGGADKLDAARSEHIADLRKAAKL